MIEIIQQAKLLIQETSERAERSYDIKILDTVISLVANQPVQTN